MTALSILLLAAALGFGVTRLLPVPAIPVLIIGGVAASALIGVEADFLEDALVIGVAVLVFAAGIELNPGRVRGQQRTAVTVGLLQFALLGIVGVSVALLLDVGLEAALYLGLALTASSTLVVVRILQRRQQLFEPLGRLVTGVLLLQDLLVILLIPVITRLPEGVLAVGSGVLGTLALAGLAGFMLRWGAPFLLQRVSFDEESLLLLTLSILFGFLWIAQFMGLPLIAGAFLAGVSLSAFPVSSLVRGQINSLSDFFNAVFFTALGAFLPIPTGAEFMQAAVLAGVVIVMTPPMVALIAERAGLSARPALAAGLLLAQTSEFSLVIGLLGVSLGHLPAELFTVIVLVTVFTMVLTPVLATDRIAHSLLRFHPVRIRVPGMDSLPKGHVLIAGCGRNGMALLEMLMVAPTRVVVVDDDPATIARVRQAGVEGVRGDVGDPAVLRRAGADEAGLVISTIRRVRDNESLLEMARGRPVLVRTFDRADAQWVEDRGGTAISYSDAAAEEFLNWIRSNDVTELSGQAEASQP